MIQNRYIALVFRLGALVFALVGIMVQIGVFRGQLWLGSFMFYTIQSNLLAVFLFTLLAIRTMQGIKKEGIHGSSGYFARFEMVCVVNLLITLIVYWILLAPMFADSFNLWSFENVATHGITPLLVLVDYVLFTRGKHLKYRDVYCVMIFPLCYIIFVYAAAWLGYVYPAFLEGEVSRFPYFFLDFDMLGFWVLAFIGGITVFFILLAHIIYFIDRRVRAK